jgi:hypothetical protein
VTRLADPAKLLAVEVAEDAPAADPLPGEAQAADELSGDGGRIEIELPSGIRVRVIPPVDAMALAHALGRNYAQPPIMRSSMSSQPAEAMPQGL